MKKKKKKIKYQINKVEKIVFFNSFSFLWQVKSHHQVNVKNATTMLSASKENAFVRRVTLAMDSTAAVSICTLLLITDGVSDLTSNMSIPMINSEDCFNRRASVCN